MMTPPCLYSLQDVAKSDRFSQDVVPQMAAIAQLPDPFCPQKWRSNGPKKPVFDMFLL